MMKVLSPKRCSGTIEIPASKSQTIRALLIAAFARDVSSIRHPLLSEDTMSAVSAIKTLGAKVNISKDQKTITVDSRDLIESSKENITIDAGNSGTTELLLMPMLPSIDATFTLIGDEQLSKRPVGPLVKSLSELGALSECNNGLPPVTIKGPLTGGSTVIECKTSQYLSGLLLGCPLSRGDSTIDCSLLYEKPYVEMTLSWLRDQNIMFDISDDLEHVRIKGNQSYHAFDRYISGDFSSASFFFAAAMISRLPITVVGLDRDDPQGDKHILDILSDMGADVVWEGNSVTVTGPKRIKGGIFDLNSIPDALPVLSIVAAFSSEDVRLVNVPQARIKETDRIKCMSENLSLLGVDNEELEDGIIIRGNGKVKGGYAKGFKDHRIIMALSVASCMAESNVIIDDERAASVTFPTFFDLFEGLRNG